MSQNPLQQYFRQPKIFIKLPSMGVYNTPGVIQGDPSNLQVYGMTGMDEILMRTPDALLSGDSTVKVIESCCPSIKSGWDVSALDLDLLLIAIRIATFGNQMNVTHTCSSCTTDNEYDVDLTNCIDYFNNYYFDNKLVLPTMVIKIRPLTYRQTTDFSLKNFGFQKQYAQLAEIADDTERTSALSQVFQELSNLQTEIYTLSIESIEVGTSVVTDRQHIYEFLVNCDSELINKIKNHINKTRDSLSLPPFTVVCDNCGAENKFSINLDQSNFFVRA